MRDVIRTVGDKVLHELVESYFSGKVYYLSNTVNYLFKDEEDALFTSNEDVINHVRKLLSDKYMLEVIPVSRVFKTTIDGEDDFTFEDVELKIILSENGINN